MLVNPLLLIVMTGTVMRTRPLAL